VRLIKNEIPPAPLVDRDGNIYTTVVISGQHGNQEWIVQNLRVTKYADGTPIPNITDSGDWGADVDGAMCWYDNDIAYKDPFGALYNYHAIAKDLAYLSRGGVQESGWHVPVFTEINDMIVDNLGGNEFAGGKMKEVGTTHWGTPNVGASNDSGFTAVGSGLRYPFAFLLGPPVDMSYCFLGHNQEHSADNMWCM
jgi:uncharacterized protein (TIGR02145 family)